MLKKDIIKSLISTNIGGFSNRIIQFITKIILARILLPEDFGIVALALIFINFLGLINGFGIDSALIQKKEKIKKLIGPAFILINIIGIFLFIFIFLSASLIALFYQIAEIKLIIRILAIILIIQPLKMIPSSLLHINFQFPKLIISEIISNLTFLFITLNLAFLGFNYWSLVIGYVCSNFIHLLFLWIFVPWEPLSKFDFSLLKELISYGKYISGAAIISFFITQGDDMFVGRILGIGALGFYSLAFAISDLTIANISHAISRVAFPMYAHFKKNIQYLKKSYIKNLQLVSFLIFPLILIIFILGKDIIYFLLGQKWLPILLPMQIFCFHGFFRAAHITSSIFLVGVGKVKLNQNILILELLILAVLIYPLTNNLGIAGAALAVVIARVCAFYLTTLAVVNKINLKLFNVFYSIYPSIFLGFCMGFMIALLNFLIPAGSLIILICYILLAFMIYLILNFLFNQEFIVEVRFIVLEFLKLKT